MHVVADFYANAEDVRNIVEGLVELKNKLEMKEDKHLVSDAIDVLDDVLGGDICED